MSHIFEWLTHLCFVYFFFVICLHSSLVAMNEETWYYIYKPTIVRLYKYSAKCLLNMEVMFVALDPVN